jgi:hypothetical protein
LHGLTAVLPAILVFQQSDELIVESIFIHSDVVLLKTPQILPRQHISVSDCCVLYECYLGSFDADMIPLITDISSLSYGSFVENPNCETLPLNLRDQSQSEQFCWARTSSSQITRVLLPYEYLER